MYIAVVGTSIASHVCSSNNHMLVLAVLRIYAVSVRRNVHKAVIVLALGLTFALSDAVCAAMN